MRELEKMAMQFYKEGENAPTEIKRKNGEKTPVRV